MQRRFPLCHTRDSKKPQRFAAVMRACYDAGVAYLYVSELSAVAKNGVVKACCVLPLEVGQSVWNL